ncbi:hypothetical protein FHS31_000513 [Sphingomonas vulcanisoli]|uniref:Uncharacterized protein n=1 Tax=Sphingomonas vulcanisoli TaxID=1658060 RepID=A0ABX0TN39_9SPHN|nr:hypothetical protein [Sphingomonas vulcanisoli]NIJ06931.1 hypothetical protein [Sphingomonas vulcanisoli]
MPRETPSPIDLPAEPIWMPGLGWTSGVLALASLVLLACNAVSLRDWAESLTPGPNQARFAEITEQWADLTDRAGIGLARAWLHARWKAAEAARFGGQPAK